MAALETAYSLSTISPHLPFYPKFPLYPKYSSSLAIQIPSLNPKLSVKSPLSPNPHFSIIKLKRFNLFSAVEEITVEETTEDETQKSNFRRKLFVLNLPWSYTVEDIKNVFGECGTVSDVEIIKHKDGKNRGFAFVTMANAEEAQAVVDKFDSHELSGRIIRIEFANRFKKTKPPLPPGPQAGETRHKLYVSNLAWKARTSHLKEFFGADYNPVSTRVVFDGPTGRSAGYGFVSFATRDEAEGALSALDGKELLGRPVRLKFSDRNAEVASDQAEEAVSSEEPQSSLDQSTSD